MGWIQLIPILFKVGLKVVSTWLEFNSDRKKLKKEGLNEVKEGIKKRDPNLINAGFSRINRVR